ncbi:acyltransferase family protein [Tumebacillus permanentifrigoris]|uniref:Peptidoglycan-N-acetylmuramate O-acetyltransferase n=1 Tax=Tumebacillus permanentifrigoris TaxID=378543 RepID=A0A316D5W9_9BACL|nr:acyltransferase family protein [Tumebacillus permanentifrigoris]PWK09650.1 peptidoglycan-N-acetylmuramate O-acetyltransferase [Tumebacillus permanentifrigoris]
MSHPLQGQVNGRYMAGLDGLRALAVLAVLAYHLNPEWAPGGLLGVGVFLVLSGYLITDILAAQWNRLGRLDLQDFWMRRVRRLLPAMLFVLVVVFVWVAIFRSSQLPSMWGDGLASVLYINNWWLIFHDVSYFEKFGPSSPLGHLWSLAVEEQFYLVWPFLLLVGLRFVRKKGWLLALLLTGAAASALAMALLYQPGTDPSRVYYGTDTRAFALLIGAALALVWPSGELKATVSPQVRLTLDLAGGTGLLVLLAMMLWSNQYQESLYRGGLVLVSVASAATVAMLAHPASRLAKGLSWEPLRWLGVRSYGIYLWHYPVVVLSSPTVDTGGFDFFRAALQVVASIGLAALSWALIEKPIRYREPAKVVSYRILTAFAVVALSIASLAVALPTPQPKPATDAVAVVASVTPPEPISEPASPPPKHLMPPSGEGVLALGDSVMLDAEPFLQELLPGIVIDAQIGRQLYEMPAVVERIKSEGKLGSRVIIQTGTNGPFSKEQLQSLLDSLGPLQQVILVNTRVPRPWESVVNTTLKEVAVANPHTTFVDWHHDSEGKDAYFYPDGVHLNPEGATYYAKLLANAVEVAD